MTIVTCEPWSSALARCKQVIDDALTETGDSKVRVKVTNNHCPEETRNPSFEVVGNCRFHSPKKCRVEQPPRPGKKLARKPEGDCMSLHIKIERTTDVAVLECGGRLVRGEALHFLKDAVTSLSRLRVVVLDLSEVETLDGGGLGMLVFLHKWTRAAGMQLKLVNPSSLVLEMLMRTRLTSVLHVSSIDDVVEIFCNADGATENVDRAVA